MNEAQSAIDLGTAISATGNSYRDYYWRTIQTVLTSESIGALKLVVGPTGLGKTYGIREAIKDIRRQLPEQRCVYTTHRMSCSLRCSTCSRSKIFPLFI